MKGRRTPGPDMTYNKKKVISGNPPGAGYIYGCRSFNLSCEIQLLLEILGHTSRGGWRE